MLLELKRQHPEPPPGPGALDDPELARCLQGAARGGNVPSFVRTLVEAAIYACTSDYVLLQPVLIELRRRHPEASCRLKNCLGKETQDGFPQDDDAFDAVVGLFGMLHVCLGRHEPGEPDGRAIRDIEGRILGRES